MIILRLNEKHAKAVAELEDKVYPEEIKLGVEDIREDLSNSRGFSFGAFSKGELKGYIIAQFKTCDYEKLSTEYKSRTNSTRNVLYISDLVCENPMFLKSLLLYFAEKIRDSYYKNLSVHVECRKSSYKIVKKLEKKGIVTINSEKFVENYYEIEDMWEIDFCINEEVLKNSLSIKEKIHLNLLNMHGRPILDIIDNLLNQKCSLESIIKNKKFILSKLNDMNLDKALSLGDTLKFRINRKFKVKDIDKKIAGLKMQGYIEENHKRDNDVQDENEIKADEINFDKKIINNVVDYKNEIHCFVEREIKLYFKSTVTDYRSQVVNKMKGFLKFYPIVTNIEIFDKYGDTFNIFTPSSICHLGVIPYYFSNLFDYAINAIKFEKKVISERLYVNNGKNNIYSLETAVLNVRKHFGEKVALNVFNAKNPILTEVSIEHDYCYLIYDMLVGINSYVCKSLLTKGAASRMLVHYSNNKIRKVNSLLTNLEFMFSHSRDNKKLSRNIDIKKIRKEISSLIKKDNVDEAIELSNKIKNEALETYNIKLEKRVLGKDRELLPSFLGRMNRYIQGRQLSLPDIINALGQKNIRDMVKGTYEGLFEPKHFYLSNSLGKDIENIFLNSPKSKKVKKLYHLLNKIKPIKSIFNGEIYGDEVSNILSILKERNFDITPSIDIAGKLHAKIEQKCSPEFLVAGDASVCCMSFGNHNANTYAKEKGFGVINFYYNERIIANSVIWINDTSNYLVVDNIEVAPNYKKENILSSLKGLYEEILGYLIDEHELDFAVQGLSYNDLYLYNKEDVNDNNTLRNDLKGRCISNTNFYSDAGRCVLIETEDSVKKFTSLKEKLPLKTKKNVVVENGHTIRLYEDQEMPF